MYKLIHLLTHSTGTLQFVLFAACFILCWNIETIYGLSVNNKKWRHAFVNAGFILTNLPLQFLLGIAFVFTIKWTGHHHFGILYRLPLMKYRIIYFSAAFLLMDFGEYIYHILMHKVKRL